MNQSTQQIQCGETLCLQPAMTFEEIGRLLGISRQDAYGIYKHGMSKLRARRRAFEKPRQTALSVSALRERREAWQNWTTIAHNVRSKCIARERA